MKKIVWIIALVAAFTGVSSANAATATTTLQGTAAIPGECRISSALSLAFGAYDASNANLSTPLDTATTFTVTCNKGSLNGGTVKVYMNGGQNATGSCSQRRLRQGATLNYLSYDIYATNTYTNPWGCATGQTYVSGAYDTGIAQSIGVYARVPAGQNSPAGSYTDTFSIILSF